MAHQLIMEEREVISQLKFAGHSAAAIARRLGRHRSTISRELRRNGRGDGYSAVVAQQQAQARRRQRPLLRKLDRPEVNACVRSGLARYWSPDQKEFSEHQRLAQQLACQVYFARPYCSWQRGTNENTNGLLRQFFPKKTDFREISHCEVAETVDLLNSRPRQRLGYRTPQEVLAKACPVAFEN